MRVGDADGRWFFTYNNDLDHPYFAPRTGFIRVKMQNQGMVGLLGREGKTRLIWLVNMDFCGIIPSSFTNALLLRVMVYPTTVVKDAQKFKDTGTLSNVVDSEHNKSVSEIVSELKAKHAMEIAALKKENAELTALTKQMNGIVSKRVADEGDE